MQAAGPDPWPGGCECGGGDTMNALPANDIEAAEPPGPARRRRAGPLRPGHGPSLAAPYRTGRHDANPWCHAGPAGPQGQQWQAGGGMSRGPAVAPEVTDGTGLARARQRFLAAQPVEPGLVRATILASWQCSRQWNIAAATSTRATCAIPISARRWRAAPCRCCRACWARVWRASRSASSSPTRAAWCSAGDGRPRSGAAP